MKTEDFKGGATNVRFLSDPQPIFLMPRHAGLTHHQYFLCEQPGCPICEAEKARSKPLTLRQKAAIGYKRAVNALYRAVGRSEPFSFDTRRMRYLMTTLDARTGRIYQQALSEKQMTIFLQRKQKRKWYAKLILAARRKIRKVGEKLCRINTPKS